MASNSKRKLQESDEVDEPRQKIVDRKSDGNVESEGIDGTDGNALPKYDLKKYKKPPAAFIFSNIKGPSGIMKDASAMADLFKDHLKFEVVHKSEDSTVFADLTGRKFKEIIARMSEEINYADRGGIAMILITHGKANGKLLFHGEDGSENTSDIDIREDVIKPFLCNAHLAGKPKIFIIAACRGGSHHAGVEVKDDTDGNTFGFPKNIDLPKDSDVIVGYSTSEGQVAIRNNEQGSWYVQEFVDVMKKLHKKAHFADLLTEVNRRVAEKTSEENGITKNMPDFTSSLRKQLYLN